MEQHHLLESKRTSRAQYLIIAADTGDTHSMRIYDVTQGDQHY